MVKRLPACVTRELKYYVYLYIDPQTNKVFYVGKGKGNRALSHLDGKGKSPHAAVIRKLRKRGLRPRVEILIHGLKDERTALAVEMAAINLLGVDALTNAVHGHHSARQGRMSLDQVLSLYQRKPAKIVEPAILIRINRLYYYGMTPTELYDATRGVWVVGAKRERAKYAFAVYQGIVREVYEISRWLPAGSTYSTRHPRGVRRKGRAEFVGVLAREVVRKKYVDRAVDKHFPPGNQNPIKYVNCDD